MPINAAAAGTPALDGVVLGRRLCSLHPREWRRMTVGVCRSGSNVDVAAGGSDRWGRNARHPVAPAAKTAGAMSVALVLLFSGSGRGAETAWPVPPCAAEGAGLVACVAGKLCVCRETAAVSPAAGGPASTRFRWDCGVLRPGCGPAGSPPATLDPYPLPPALSLDRSSTTVTTVTGDGTRVHTRDRGSR